MAALGSQSIASSYEQLLHVDRDGGGNTTNLVDIKDGDNGTTFALQLATDKVQANGTLTVGVDDTGYDVKFFGDTATNGFMLWDASTDDLILGSSSKLGIGVTDPATPLEIAGSGAEAELIYLTSTQSANTSNRVRQSHRLLSDSQERTSFSLLSGFNTITDGSRNSIVEFKTSNSGTFGTAMVIDGNSVGIGTASPSSKLHLYQQGDATNNELTLEMDSSSGGNTGNQYITMIREDTNRGNEIKFVTHAHGGSAVHKFSLGQTDSDESGVDGTEFYIGRSTLGANPDFTITSAGKIGMGTASIDSDSFLHLKANEPNIFFEDDNDNQDWRIYAGSAFMIQDATNTKNLFKLDANSRISLSNNDSGGTTGGDSTSGNTLFGYLAGANIADGGIRNTAIGHGASNALTTGDDNVTIGRLSGVALTTGASNTAIGSDTLVTEDTGTHSTAIGYSALKLQNYNGEAGNTAIGANSLDALTVGRYNVAVGSASASSTQEVLSTVAIGYGALNGGMTTDALGTIGIGHGAGAGITSGQYNVAIGYLSMDSNQTGDKNTAVGYQTLSALTGVDGEQANTSVGYTSGASITSGLKNSSLGSECLDALTTGDSNVAMGQHALGSETIGNQTVAIGAETLYNQTMDADENSNNVGVGYKAGYRNVTGTGNTLIGHSVGLGASGQSHSNNTGVGYLALKSVTTGSSNTAIGRSAMENTTTAHTNVAIGGETMGGITTATVQDATVVGYGAFKGSSSTTTGANGTTAIGRQALAVLTSGAGNTAIGYQVGHDMTIASNNTLVGYQAGGTGTHDITGGSNNTLIGYQAKTNNANASNQTAIGKGAVGQGDNTVTLGNADVTHVCLGHEGTTAVALTAGIQFPASQVANGGANVLDDYEEGTWTPAFVSGSGHAPSSITVTRAVYTKIGNVVTLEGNIGFDDSGGGGDPFTLSDVPFNFATNSFPTGVANFRFTAFSESTMIYALGNAASNQLTFYYNNGSGDRAFVSYTNTDVASNTLTFTITYII